ncbi:hypothetical protein KY321_02625 [Candidatus Woesearchaeota archaeon]|nr:hypothetical protein [Candidatus Woesearchaeota archaeon]
MKKIKWMIVLLFLVIPLSSAWDGIPPTNLLIYGEALVNAAPLEIGDVVSVHEINDGYQNVGQINVEISGWYPGLSIPWDNPDTPTDEGLTYSYPLRLAFNIDGRWVNYYEYSSSALTDYWDTDKEVLSINNGLLEGIPTQVDLIVVDNTPPTIYANNHNAVQGSQLIFTINATDDTTYRTDTLTLDGNLGSVAQSTFTSMAEGTVTYTPSCSDACTGTLTPTFTATDDGRPSLSDSEQISINIQNINDAPNINNREYSILAGDENNINLRTLMGYSDCDSCLGDGYEFSIISAIPTELNFSLTDSLGNAQLSSLERGTYQVTIQVIDDEGLSDTAILTIIVYDVEGVIVVKNIRANSNKNYNLSVKIYNYNNESLDLSNLVLIDSRLNSSNLTFDLDYRENIEFRRDNFTFSESGFYEFGESEVLSSQLGRSFYSNIPKIHIGSTTTSSGGGGGGGGGSGSSCEDTECYYLWECGDWSDCVLDMQVRYCRNTGTCAGDIGKPSEVRSCKSEEKEERDEILICHKPGTSVEETIKISNSSWEEHKIHGDIIGPCKEEDKKEEKKEEKEIETQEWSERFSPPQLIQALNWLLLGGIFGLIIFFMFNRKEAVILSDKSMFRGPIAQDIFNKLLKENKLSRKYKAKSYTLNPFDKKKPSEKLVKFCEEKDIDLKKYKTKTISIKELRKSERIIVANAEIKKQLSMDVPEQSEKIESLKTKRNSYKNQKDFDRSYKNLKNKTEHLFYRMFADELNKKKKGKKVKLTKDKNIKNAK